ncbi:hypothetical protein [Clostridium sp. FP1]|uniref:hypothetical protein n=1 Tax=Clostridium sp. FP1 TaxID=2724076 RepID=UPI0013E90AE2|nr:hypothetical protein [Clostridium sp. FP1]MBZ9634600.1 hypothetical protein [Clostridium sp. FP1]
MQYKEFIKADEAFQYSINLQYDLNKLEKLNGYIPTNLSIEILNYYLKSIYYDDSKERASVLIGPYGKGKSHLLLTLLGIVSLGNDEKDEELNLSSTDVLNKLNLKIGNLDKETSEMIKEIRKQNKKLLPIVINSNYLDLNQAFLIALKEALDREQLKGLLPNTYFNAVLDTVKIWEEKFKDTYKLFENKLKNHSISFKDFMSKIKSYDSSAYEIFKEIHPEVTSGTEFNPLIKADIIKLYEEVNTKICEKENYRGMFIVFDEFSKFLEASITKNSSNDIKIIQDLAELANRSGKCQIHFTCVTHKGINDYISNLPKEKIDAWRAVEGRFKQTYFTSSSQQNYELISNAIIKNNELFTSFLKNDEEKFNNTLSLCGRLGLFDDVPNYEDILGNGCYPLNPIATYVLPRVSEKVAQNERTLFTFLSKDEKGSLMRFVNTHDGKLEFLTLDWIYDYFKILFKKEVFNERVHVVWLKTQAAIDRVKDRIERKIIKAIAIIYIVNELDGLQPIDITIRASLGLDQGKYDKAITSLINKKVLIKKRSNSFYGFLPGGNLNVSKHINGMKELKAKKINIKEVLEGIVDLGYSLPKMYNDEYEMVRFFKNIFINSEDFLTVSNEKDLLKMHKSDGIIFYLVYKDDEEKKKVIEHLRKLNSKRILMCIPNIRFENEEELKEYIAIQYLKQDEDFISQDDYIAQELSIYDSDIREDIENYISKNFDIKYEKCAYYMYNGKVEDIKKPANISRKLSYICKNVFQRTPKINNEMINKMNISSPISKARNKIVRFIFEGKDINDFEIQGTSPEATIFRATIINKGLSFSKDKSYIDLNINTVLDKIGRFILSCEQEKKSFCKLYEDLYGNEFGVRAGIIPIYLAFKMRDHKENITIYFADKEVALSAETLSRINDNPEKYFLLLDDGTKEKVDYIKNLENIFKRYKSNSELGYNRYIIVLDAMQNWIHSLPKYTRDYKLIFNLNGEIELSKEAISLRKELLKYDVNPREFLFERLLKKILKEESLEKSIENIQEIKNELDNHLEKFKDILIQKTKELFDKDYNGELSSVLKNWYSNLNETRKKHLYDVTTNKLLNYIAFLDTSDKDVIIETLARTIIGLYIEDWNDDTLENYLEILNKFKNEVENYEEVAVSTSKLYEISYYLNDEKIEKTFEEKEISAIGGTLLNEVEQTIEEYGDSIDSDEKRNILMKLMEKFM